MEKADRVAGRILTAFLQGRLSRREALQTLRTAGLSAVALRLLGGEAFADAAGTAVGPGGIPLARPNRPVKLPVFQDPIKSGLEPEKGGVFNIFNYADYVDKNLLDAFGKKYDVEVRVTTFDSMDQGITRLATGGVRDMDVTEIISNRIAQAVAGKLVQPINKDYIPNLKKNCWPQFMSPFYDVDAQYTIPYTIYTTGIGWRNDKVKEDIAKLDNPWSIFWNSEKYKGYVSVLDDSREAVAMAMLYRGEYDINTEDPKIIDQALADLLELVKISNVKVNITGYQTLPEGTCWLAHSWSGNLLSGVFAYMPKGGDPNALSYWTPRPRQGTDPERHVGRLLDLDQAGAGPSLAELPARRAERLQQFRQLQRLPAAHHLDHGGIPDRQQADPRKPARGGHDAGRSGPGFPAGGGADQPGAEALADRLCEVQRRGLSAP